MENMKKYILISIIAILLFPNLCKGMEPNGGRAPLYVIMKFHKCFENEGAFVLIPAEIGKYSFSIVGVILIAPFEIGYSVLNDETSHPTRSMKLSELSFGSIGNGLFGVPFYLVKKTIWDFPIYSWKIITGKIKPKSRILYHFHTDELRVDIKKRKWLSRQIEYDFGKNGNFLNNDGDISYSYKGHGFLIKLENNIVTVNGGKYIIVDKVKDIRIEDGKVKLNGLIIEPEYSEDQGNPPMDKNE
jgi:hypothetical protein